jgi:hypothetical protein
MIAGIVGEGPHHGSVMFANESGEVDVAQPILLDTDILIDYKAIAS